MIDLVTHTTDDTFETDVLNSDLPVILDFWAPWCNPCNALSPFLDAIAKDFEGRLRIVKLNIDENPKVKAMYGVRGIPTLIGFAGGEPKDRASGPTVTRLRVLAQNTVGATESGTGESDDIVVADALPLSSFAGSESKKTACIARLKEAALDTIQPVSACAAGAGKKFDASLGLPDAFGAFVDLLFRKIATGRSDESAREAIVSLFEAIPVGANLANVSMRLNYWLLHDRQWGSVRYAGTEGAQALFRNMAALHDRELSAGSTASASWEKLERDALALSDTERRKAENQQAGERLANAAVEQANTFERQSQPLSSLSPNFLFLQRVTLALNDFSAYPEWSDEERGRTYAILTAEHGKVVSTMEPAPAPGTDGAREWQKRLREGTAAAMEAARLQEPALWQRHDAWQEYEKTLGATFGDAVIAFLIADVANQKSTKD